jgi:hypothetical protein
LRRRKTTTKRSQRRE